MEKKGYKNAIVVGNNHCTVVDEIHCTTELHPNQIRRDTESGEVQAYLLLWALLSELKQLHAALQWGIIIKNKTKIKKRDKDEGRGNVICS